MKAFIDLGTNTFHCKIVSFDKKDFKVIYYDKIFVKIGEGGIGKGYITEAALKRANLALSQFQDRIESFNVKDIIAIGTSALRNANNSSKLIDQMTAWNWRIEIIEGKREAELIYKGILLDACIPKISTSLIMDIGGGSVEFIIGENGKIKWSQSFEIGAQRLKDQFHTLDPISKEQVKLLFHFLEATLEPLTLAINKHNPKILVGSSGTFDTIMNIKNEQSNQKNNIVSVTDFQLIKDTFINSNLKQRLQLNGMIKERAEMIVTASLLLDFVLNVVSIKEFYVSSNALKEGLIYEEIHRLKA